MWLLLLLVSCLLLWLLGNKWLLVLLLWLLYSKWLLCNKCLLWLWYKRTRLLLLLNRRNEIIVAAHQKRFIKKYH